MEWILAAKDASGDDATEFYKRLMLGLVAIIVIAGILLGILSVVRRRMNAADKGTGRDFSLGDLRTLHREGKLTDDEFQRAKSKLVSAVQRDLAKKVEPTLAERPMGEELKDS